MAEQFIPNVPRPISQILTNVPDVVEKEDEAEDPNVPPRRLYFANSMQVVNINMVFTPNDLIPEYPQRSFHPALVHQIFPGDGIIYGYRNLNVDIYFLANSAKCFVDLQYTEISNPDMPNHSPPDNIYQQLSPWLPEDYYMDKSQFVSQIYKENHRKMFGTPLDRVALYNGKEKTLHTYIFTLCTNEDPQFRQFHSRFQCMLVWFIDGASQIDIDDPNWMFIYVYETRNQNEQCETSGVYPVGFATVYKFFHYPDKIRARISQFFVIPPCQGIGVGTRLLKSTYLAIQTLPNVVDITVEEPCMSFIRMRDFIDCQLLMDLEPFKRGIIHKGFTSAMFKEANKHYKLSKRQTRRVYEILRFLYTKCNTNIRNYSLLRDEIRDHLKLPYMRELVVKSCDTNGDRLMRSTNTLEQNVTNYLLDIKKAACSLNTKLGGR